MTNPSHVRARILAALVVASALALATWATACTRTESLDPSKMPEGVRADYALFAQRCSKCHSLARPLSANISDDAQWVLYVNRMRRQPGSGITLEDQDVILRFLRWYAADLRRLEAQKRGLVPAPSASPAPGLVPAPGVSPVPTTASPPGVLPAAPPSGASDGRSP